MITINGGVDSKKICTRKRTLLLAPTQRHDSKKTVKEIAKMKLFLLVFGSGFRPEAGISVFVDTLPVAWKSLSKRNSFWNQVIIPDVQLALCQTSLIECSSISDRVSKTSLMKCPKHLCWSVQTSLMECSKHL